jgi:hypothetical protein
MPPFSSNCLDADERSPRTVQQMQPLFISREFLFGVDDEFVVNADLSKFVLDHGDSQAMLSVRMRLSRVVLPAQGSR